MEKLSFENPSVIKINDTNYLGIISGNQIINCFDAGDKWSPKEDLMNYLKELYAGNCVQMDLRINQNIISRQLNKIESSIWDDLVYKFNYVVENANKTLINKYYDNYIRTGCLTG